MQAQRSPKVIELIEKSDPLLGSLDLNIRDIEILGGARNCTVRVVIDRLDQAGVGIEDCIKAHRILGPSFDEWDPFPHAYTLEVVSPGEQPPLRTWAHFEQALGQSIQFETETPVPLPPPAKPRKNWKSVLKELNNQSGNIIVEDNYGKFEIPIQNITSASWLREWK